MPLDAESSSLSSWLRFVGAIGHSFEEARSASKHGSLAPCSTMLPHAPNRALSPQRKALLRCAAIPPHHHSLTCFRLSACRFLRHPDHSGLIKKLAAMAKSAKLSQKCAAAPACVNRALRRPAFSGGRFFVLVSRGQRSSPGCEDLLPRADSCRRLEHSRHRASLVVGAAAVAARFLESMAQSKMNEIC